MAKRMEISLIEAYDLLPLTGKQMTEFKTQLDILRRSLDLRDAFVYQRIKEAFEIQRDATKRGQKYPA